MIPRATIAAATLFSGWLHLTLYFDSYRNLDVGPSFAANAVASAVVGVAVLASRHPLTRLAAAGLAVATLGGFVASRTVGIFGFEERGFQPSPDAALNLVAQGIVLGAVAFTFVRQESDETSPQYAWAAAPLVIAAAVGFAVASSDEGQPEVAAPATDAVVDIVDFEFAPADIEITAGSTVSFVNRDGVPHTVDADNGQFASGNLGAGESTTVRFDAPGTYTYFCEIHPFMTGSVTVTG